MNIKTVEQDLAQFATEAHGSLNRWKRFTTLSVDGSVHGLSDAGLVEAAKSGHSMAFGTLSERYRKQLFRAALRITRSREDAEDAVQDTLLRAYAHVADFDGRSSFGTWLTRIAINSAPMILRKKRTSHEIATDYSDEFVAEGLHYKITDLRPNPEGCYAAREEESTLKKAIHGLRPALRAVVQTQCLQERSVRETAQVMGITISATKGRLFHAKKALRRSLRPNLLRQPRFADGFVLCLRHKGSQSANTRTD
jgi:RNA polymerase sigma-70 factor (ECF subfamily)